MYALSLVPGPARRLQGDYPAGGVDHAKPHPPLRIETAKLQVDTCGSTEWR